jgi:hypothetical protein
MRARLTHLLLALLVVLAPSSAWAEGPVAAAILNLEGEDVDPEMTKTLTSIVRNEALQVEKYQVVNKYPIQLQDVLLVLDCSAESPSCLKLISEQVNARVLIYGTVQKRDSRFKIELNVFDAETGRMLNRLVRTLDETTDPVIGFRKEIEAFFAQQRGEALTRLQIGSSVEGARILINGTFVGTVPLERKGLPPGSYDLEVQQEGYEPWKKTVSLAPGADERVWAPLEKMETPEPEVASPTTETGSTTTKTVVTSEPDVSAERVPTTNWGAWSAVVVGGLSLGGSLGFGLAMENTERTLEEENDAGTLTEARLDELYDRGENFELAHRVLLGVGAVALTTGVVWLLLDSGERAASLNVGVGVDGVSARLRW